MNIIKNNEIHISEENWIKLNETRSKDEIKKLISDAIGNNNLPMPMREIDVAEAKENFEVLKSDTTEPIKGLWFPRYDYNRPLTEYYFPISRVGNLTSDYFHQENRWCCDSINAPSPYRTWHSERFRWTLLNALWTLKVKSVTSRTLRTAIGLRKYIASQFRPSTAKAVYNYFYAERVLDISSGWGDRLSGFLASDAERYVGVDPNVNLIEGYQKQIDMFNTDKSVKMISGCAESVDYGDEMFDMIFTSPPYFNIERYTQESNQSFKKYKKLDVWLNEFLFVAIENAWNHLERNGLLILNISDVYSNHKINKICDPMNDFIATLPNATYNMCMGYQMAKRPNSGALKNKEGKFAEPMWVWSKT